MINIRKFFQGIGFIPVATTAADTEGEMEYLSTTHKASLHNGSILDPLVTEAAAATLTNKVINGSNNTITNVSSTSGLASMPANTVIANITGGTAVPTNAPLVSTNTVSSAVFRDGSGNFSAGTITASLSGNASTVTTNANLTGPITSVGNATSVASQTGTGSTFVMNTAPTLSNPIVGTQSTSDSSTKAASTAFVATAIANAIAGVNPAIAAQAATTSASDTSALTYNNGVSGIGATLTGANNTALTVDGYTFTALGQRLLVKNDTQSPSGAFNGLYYVTQVQASVLPLILTRALDYDMPSDINNTGAIPVINGTANTDTSWLLTSQVNTVGTDPLTYTQFTINPTKILTTTLTSAHILVGNGSNLATDVAVSGDLTLANTGAYTIANLAVTNAKIANSTIDLTTKVTGVLPAANVGLGRTLNAQTGTTYTFVLSDGSAAGANTVVTASNASAQTYTVPTNASVAFPVGTQIDLIQLGAGKVTLAAAGGVTINSFGSVLSVGGQYIGVTLTKTATDTWVLIGNIIA